MAVPASRRSSSQPFRGKPGRVVQNRMKREKRRINIRGFLRKAARGVIYLSVASLGVLLVYEAYSLVSRASFFRLEIIEVSPLKRLTREEVIAQAGIKPGDDLTGLRLERIGEQLTNNPWVEKVRIRRYLPHTIAIEIAEQEPVAVASMGYLYYLNAKGELFKLLTEGDNLDYPVLTGISEDDLSRDPTGSKEALKSMLALVELLKGREVLRLEDVSEVHYDKGYGFTIFMADRGVPVRLGRTGFEEKLARFGRIYATLQPQMKAVEYIDLDYTDKIVVKSG
ncbi:cell division protein FtsQ [Geobacter sp. OR-1]|uniref:cell division protein FtsQ/DivIB n=1 Tax=Geobacter sp. OR-1 TaxID=1266765 RepID=UPI000542DC5B|nr:cell division protein FtsQ/DivIB [Geobacter sp. OR-1]GAM09508.1 cell division protein FtsQ [Geobacter sp. OR-1]